MSHPSVLEGVEVLATDILMPEDTDPLHQIVLLCGLIVMAEVIVIGIAGDLHRGVIAAHLDAEVHQDTGGGAFQGVLYPAAQFGTVPDAIVAVLSIALLQLHLQGFIVQRDGDLSLPHQHQDPLLFPPPNGQPMFHDQDQCPRHHLGVQVEIRAWCPMVMALLILGIGRILFVSMIRKLLLYVLA